MGLEERKCLIGVVIHVKVRWIEKRGSTNEIHMVYVLIHSFHFLRSFMSFDFRVAQMAGDQETADKQSEPTLSNPSQKQETRDEVLFRNRKEISNLQKKETEMKKAAAKGSKAEQKAKKKQVEEEISQLSAKLKEKHAQELASLGYSTSNENEKNSLDNLVKAIAGVSVASQPDHSKPSKSTKRDERKELSKKLQESKEFKKSGATL
ncbi:hypothetical protein SLEP1_g23277 [Rubroshorea leprosula]|uniref:Uncharacterized protein n=1 Tax=Rubroshorea leprosula TaxID=152421 RepID=A0AAV5JKM5_9ROSI|nr:hypothetical protein SLEP1_g23277 [Rubroshorea leprosula]